MSNTNNRGCREIFRRYLLLAPVLALGLLSIVGTGGGGGEETTPTYTIGGTVSGLAGSGLVLQNNGGDNRSITANGSFTFATTLANGAAYNVTVFTQPAGGSCSVTNGSGTVNAANVTNVSVTCVATATPVSGSVLAPGGSLAFNSQKGWRRWFAGIFGARAEAAVAGTLPVGAGISVKLIEIDANGAQVGGTIATTTTDVSGNYLLLAPLGFSPASRYVVRAEGTGGNLDAIVTATSDLTVDPISHATVQALVGAVNDLSGVTPEEVVVLRNEVSEVVQDVNPAGLGLSALNTQLAQAVSNDDGLRFMFSNAAAPYSICGQVTYLGTPHAGIDVVVRDYVELRLQGKAVTDASGNYCVSANSGSYVVGALNRTNTSYAASEWWSSGGTNYRQEDADGVLVTSGTTTANFALEAGGRIEGTATASGGTLNGQPLEAVQVTLYDFRSGETMGSAMTDASGVYRFNVIPGGNGYRASVYNRTWRPYASFHHNGTAAGTNSSLEATKVVITASAAQSINLGLTPGSQLAAQVLSQPSGGLPVVNARIRVNVSYASNPYNKSGTVIRQRTDRDGYIRAWLKPDTYVVQTQGQTAPADLTSSNQSLNFNSQVGTVTATIKDNIGNPLRHVSVFLHDSAGTFVNQENSNGNGGVTLYAVTTAANYLLEVRIDKAKPYASIVYNNKMSLFAGTDGIAGDPIAITVGGNTALGDITLPAAGVLKGTLTYTGGAPAGGVVVQVRYGGTASDDRFINVNARGDGSYDVSLPAATYNRVRGGGTTGTNVDGVVVSAGSDTTVDITLP
jgi:hypothetical protein